MRSSSTSRTCLFHGVCKHICDSVWYLYNTPRTSYSQLMATAHKAKSKNEEIQDKVRASTVVMTDPGEGTVELGQQIAQLMAALIKAGQGKSPCSAPSSPWERGCGRGHNSSRTPVIQTPLMARTALLRPP